MRQQITRAAVSSDDPALLDWLIARLAGLEDEWLVALYLDEQGGLLCDETFRSGARDCMTIMPRTLFRQAMRLECRRMILAHNHPSGIGDPSALDIEATFHIGAHARFLGIDLMDHLIVAGSSVTSMRRAGLM